MIKQYPSLYALRQHAIDLNALEDRYSNDSWFGDESVSQTLEKTLFGDRTLVPTAEELISQISAQIETPKRTWEPYVAGAYPSIPDFVAGRPTSMRRMVTVTDDHAPITILALSTSSGGIGAGTLAKRGTVILALTLILTRIRPVSLYTVSILDGTDGECVLSTRINTAPLDLSVACYILTSAGFARRLNYGLSYKIDKNCSGGWPRGFNYNRDQQPYYDHLAKALSPEPERTLVIGAAKLNDPILKTPIEWINDQISRFIKTKDD